MEQGDRKLQLENDLRSVEQYLDHPITKRIFTDNADEQEKAVALILEVPVVNVETFLAREQALGHLRGLRRGKAIVLDDMEDIKEELKTL